MLNSNTETPLLSGPIAKAASDALGEIRDKEIFYKQKVRRNRRAARASVSLTTAFYVIAALVFTMSILGVSDQITDLYRSAAPAPWNGWTLFRKDTDIGIAAMALGLIIGHVAGSRGYDRAWARYEIARFGIHSVRLQLHTMLQGLLDADPARALGPEAAELARSHLERAHAIAAEERASWSADVTRDFAALRRLATRPTAPLMDNTPEE